MASKWTDEYAIMRDLSKLQGRVPGATADTVSSQEKPPTQRITENTEEEFYQSYVGDGDFAPPDLGLIKQMLNIVRDVEVSSDVEEDSECVIHVSKLNPLTPVFVPKNGVKDPVSKTLTPTKAAIKSPTPTMSKELITKETKPTKDKTKFKINRNVALNSIFQLQKDEENKIDSIPQKLESPKVKNSMKVVNGWLDAQEKLSSEVLDLNSNLTTKKCAKSPQVVAAKKQPPPDLIESSRNTDKTLVKPKIESAKVKTVDILNLDPTSMFRKKKVSAKTKPKPVSTNKTKPVPTAAAGRSSQGAGTYVPSEECEEHFRIFKERSQVQEIVQDDVWSRAERKMKEIDERRRLELEQFHLSSNENQASSPHSLKSEQSILTNTVSESPISTELETSANSAVNQSTNDDDDDNHSVIERFNVDYEWNIGSAVYSPEPKEEPTEQVDSTSVDDVIKAEVTSDDKIEVSDVKSPDVTSYSEVVKKVTTDNVKTEGKSDECFTTLKLPATVPRQYHAVSKPTIEEDISKDNSVVEQGKVEENEKNDKDSVQSIYLPQHRHELLSNQSECVVCEALRTPRQPRTYYVIDVDDPKVMKDCIKEALRRERRQQQEALTDKTGDLSYWRYDDETNTWHKRDDEEIAQLQRDEAKGCEKEETNWRQRDETSWRQKEETSWRQEKEILGCPKENVPVCEKVKEETHGTSQNEAFGVYNEETLGRLKEKLQRDETEDCEKEETNWRQREETSWRQEKEILGCPEEKVPDLKEETHGTSEKEAVGYHNEETFGYLKEELYLRQIEETDFFEKGETFGCENEETTGYLKEETPGYPKKETSGIQKKKHSLPQSEKTSSNIKQKEEATDQPKSEKSGRRKNVFPIRKREGPLFSSRCKRDRLGQDAFTRPKTGSSKFPKESLEASSSQKEENNLSKGGLEASSSQKKEDNPSKGDLEASYFKKEEDNLPKGGLEASSSQKEEDNLSKVGLEASSSQKEEDNLPKRGSEASSSQKKEDNPSKGDLEASYFKKEEDNLPKGGLEASSSQKEEDNLSKGGLVASSFQKEEDNRPKGGLGASSFQKEEDDLPKGGLEASSSQKKGKMKEMIDCSTQTSDSDSDTEGHKKLVFKKLCHDLTPRSQKHANFIEADTKNEVKENKNKPKDVVHSNTNVVLQPIQLVDLVEYDLLIENGLDPMTD